MKETFQSFENQKPIPTEAVPPTDEIWTRNQIKEMTDQQEQGRRQRFAEAHRYALDTALNSANYVAELLKLELEPEELSRFSGFFEEIKTLKSQK